MGISPGLRKAAELYPLMVDGEVPERLKSPVKKGTSRALVDVGLHGALYMAVNFC